MHASVIVFPGSNCDRDAKTALQKLGFTVSMVWHQDKTLPKTDFVVLPGGFSYGDYLRSGAMAARSSIMQDVVRFANAGGKVAGICNGFQVLTEAGLLPGALMRNRGLTFLCKPVTLRVENTDTPFTKRYAKGGLIRVPVAHHDGNYTDSAENIARLEGEGQVVFRYAAENGDVNESTSINGSINSIAGVTNAKRNVLGLMPHPERVCDPYTGGTDGRALFQSVLESAAA